MKTTDELIGLHRGGPWRATRKRSRNSGAAAIASFSIWPRI